LTDISLPEVEYSGVLAVYLNPDLETFNSGITLVGSIKAEVNNTDMALKLSKFEVIRPHIVGASRRDSYFQGHLGRRPSIPK
jgi:hypothetical protein